MKNWTGLLSITLLFACVPRVYASPTPTLRSRLIILADMGNEPDEVQQMAYMAKSARVSNCQVLSGAD